MVNALNRLDSSCTKTADLRNTFDGIDKPIFYDVGHTNDLGNKLIAKKLLVTNNRLFVTNNRQQSIIGDQ